MKTINGEWDWTEYRASIYRPLARRIDELVKASDLGSKVLMGGMKSGFLPQLLPHLKFDVVEINQNQVAGFDNVTIYHQDWYDVPAWPTGPHAVIVEDLGVSLRSFTDITRKRGPASLALSHRLEEGTVLIAMVHLAGRRIAHAEWRAP